jgi:glycosidase
MKFAFIDLDSKTGTGLSKMYTIKKMFTWMMLALLVSCAVISGPASQGGIPDGYGVVDIEIPEIRGWTVASYTVTATRSGEAPVTVMTSDSSVSMTLKLGGWNIAVEGTDQYGSVIYQGVANAVVTESGTSVTVGLLKRAGNVTMTIKPLAGYDITPGNPGSIEKITVKAHRVSFPDIEHTVNNFESSLFFSGLAQGEWDFTVSAMSRDIDPADYTPLSTYSTYVSGSFSHEVIASQVSGFSNTLNTQEKVTPVLFSHGSGTYSSSVMLELSCETADSIIYYTVDGTEPTTGSTVYSTPVTISAGIVVVKAMAAAPGVTGNSITAVRTFTIDNGVTSTPGFTPAGGTYSEDQVVSISSPDGGLVYYTLDGSLPTQASTLYSGPIPVSGDGTVTVIRAVALAAPRSLSSVASGTFIIEYPEVVTPVISPSTGTYSVDQVFTIECGTPGANIYYTIDGSEPTSASTPYSGAFTLPEGSVMVKAFAVATGYSDSPVVSANYTITSQAISSIQLTEADVIVPGIDYMECPLTAGVTWFGFEIDTAGTYELDWLVGFSGVVTVFENDMETVVPAVGSGDLRTVSIIPGRYFVTVNSTYDVSSFIIRLQYSGIFVTTTTTSTSSSTTTTSTTVDPGDGIAIYFEKPASWSDAWIWYDKDSDDIWETTELSTPPGDMTLYRPDWYVKVISDTTSVTFLFNDGTWINKVNDSGGDFTATVDTWVTADGTAFDYDPTGPVIPVVRASPTPGTYLAAQDVSLTSSNGSEDVIYYTTNGTGPTINSPIYTIPVTVTSSMDIRAIARNEFDEWGSVYTFSYVIDADADFEKPTINADVTPGRYEDPVDVTFTITDNKSETTTAYYTTDGTTPNTFSTVYASGDASTGLTGTSIQISSNTTFRFLVVDAAGNISQASFYYPIGSVFVSTREDFREESVYFLLTPRFYDGDPANTRPSEVYESSGNAAYNDPSWRGDFKGLIQKLDYIKALGFTAIWINPPVMNRNYYDYHGYHGWDFTRIDKRLESPDATYQDLIDEVHARDMKIIQDIVLNHSGRFGLKDQCEVKYWGDRNDPEWGVDGLDYYDEYNPDFEYDGVSIEPNSGKSWYNGDLWTNTFPEYVTWDPIDEYYFWNGETHSHANDHNLWGIKSPYSSPEGYKIWHFQWPGMYESQFSLLDPDWFHCFWLKNWEDYTSQYGTIHEDCLDLNTESQVVQEYLLEAYGRYIEMGVDGFRIDTVKHIPRIMFNRHFNPGFHQIAADAGNDNFYMVGEVCVRDHGVWNKGQPPISQPFYTWKEQGTFSSDDSIAAFDAYEYAIDQGEAGQPTSNNHYLDGNDYRQPDYSENSGLNVIDFRMHWNFSSAGNAFNVRGGDHYSNDATWNLTYVESHDYSPVEVGNSLYARVSDQDMMAEGWTLMWTWRGIPCIFYGNEILFKAGEIIDEGPNRPLEESGRAYFGDHIEGGVVTSGFGEWSNATGEMANTLSHPLALHVQRLNRIRLAVPALQKGQYSTDNVSGGMAFKRRFADLTNGVDSYVLVTISGDADFTDILNGTYVDCVTGDVQVVSDNSLQISCSGQGNARIYVLDLSGQGGSTAPGKIGTDTDWLK